MTPKERAMQGLSKPPAGLREANWIESVDWLTAIITEAIEAEREACAQIADTATHLHRQNADLDNIIPNIAASITGAISNAIRARST